MISKIKTFKGDREQVGDEKKDESKNRSIEVTKS
jgi:hypothetical protein